MTGEFPLYDNLYNTVLNNTVDLTQKEKEIFIEKVKIIDKNARELIFALIRYHQFKNNDGMSINILGLPFSGKKQKSGIKFELDNFPIILKHILLEFINTHNKSVEEDKHIRKNSVKF